MIVSDAVLMSIVSAVAPTLAALGAAIAVMRSRRSTKKDLREIHVLVNGRLSEALQEIVELRDFIDKRVRVSQGETSASVVPPIVQVPPELAEETIANRRKP